MRLPLTLTLTLTQMNYPYPVPPFAYGWPVNRTCARLTSSAARSSDAALLAAMGDVAADFYSWKVCYMYIIYNSYT